MPSMELRGYRFWVPLSFYSAPSCWAIFDPSWLKLIFSFLAYCVLYILLWIFIYQLNIIHNIILIACSFTLNSAWCCSYAVSGWQNRWGCNSQTALPWEGPSRCYRWDCSASGSTKTHRWILTKHMKIHNTYITSNTTCQDDPKCNLFESLESFKTHVEV